MFAFSFLEKFDQTTIWTNKNKKRQPSQADSGRSRVPQLGAAFACTEHIVLPREEPPRRTRPRQVPPFLAAGPNAWRNPHARDFSSPNPRRSRAPRSRSHPLPEGAWLRPRAGGDAGGAAPNLGWRPRGYKVGHPLPPRTSLAAHLRPGGATGGPGSTARPP